MMRGKTTLSRVRAREKLLENNFSDHLLVVNVKVKMTLRISAPKAVIADIAKPYSSPGPLVMKLK